MVACQGMSIYVYFLVHQVGGLIRYGESTAVNMVACRGMVMFVYFLVHQVVAYQRYVHSRFKGVDSGGRVISH